MTISLFMNKDKNPEIGQKDKHDIFPMSLHIPVSSTLMPLCFNIRCNPSLSWRTVPFYALIVQRLTSNWIIEETPRENHSLLSLICLLTKMATRNFLIPQWTFVAKKELGYRWEQAGVFGSNIPLALPIDPWKFHVDVLKRKKSVLRKTTAYFMTRLAPALPEF